MIATNPNSDDGAAYSDAGEVVPSVGFDFGAVDPADTAPEELATQSDALRLERHQCLRLVTMTLRLLQTNGDDAEVVGRRVLVYLNQIERCETQSALASRLKMTPGRVAQIKHQFAPEYKAFCQILLGSGASD